MEPAAGHQHSAAGLQTAQASQGQQKTNFPQTVRDTTQTKDGNRRDKVPEDSYRVHSSLPIMKDLTFLFWISLLFGGN